MKSSIEEQDRVSFKYLREQLAKLDAYPKTLEDFRIKTFCGAAVTTISIIIILILFCLELNQFLTPFVHEELIVDISNNKKLTINFDITFPKIICSHLSLDATDVSGEQHINIEHNVFKTKLDEFGVPLDSPEKVALSATKSTKSPPLSANVTLDPNRCESCYGAESEKKKCCNTCREVREAYNAKGWGFPNPTAIEQCRREGDTTVNPKEGCQLFGKIEVNKIAGNFHIALGQSFERNHAHVHDINLGDLFSVNTSHRIDHLSFGEKLDKTVNQLDGTTFISEEGNGLATFQYYLKIVPTLYQRKDGTEIRTNQFAVTRFKKEFGNAIESLSEARLPGVFFIYEFAPMLVKYSEMHHSLTSFLTSICSIVGGILTVAGIIDSFIYYGYKELRAKIQIGKFS